jgi:putative hydroxymethylpyrimidine transport system substrate-binding protein
MKKLAWLLLMQTSVTFAAPQKLTVVLDWFINPNHAPLIIAEQQGYFKEQNLEVEFIAPPNPNDPSKWVAADKADIGITYQPEFMQQVDQGLPLIRIGTLIDQPLSCVVALTDNKVQALSDLKNKRIGTSNSGLSNLLVNAMLEKQGLQQKDIELINVQYNLTQALLSHKVDAVAGLLRNVEVPELEFSNHKMQVFFPEDYGIPTYSELIFVSHIKHAHDKRFPRFLTALKKAVRYLDEHPKESWGGFIKKYPEANNTVNRESWFATIPYFAEEPGTFNSSDWQQFADFMRKNKLIASNQPLSRYAIALKDG